MRDVLDERILDAVLGSVRCLVIRRVGILAELCARIMVALTQALEEELGREKGFQVARRAFEKLAEEKGSRPPAPDEDRSLRAFCAALEEGCIGTQNWTRVEDRPDRVGYRFTRCVWAEFFQELGRTDVGHWFCDGDASGARAFNPRIGFQRTQVLMDGDACCDHLYYLEPEEA